MDETQEIAGYRVLRRIARGARSTVLLAHGGEPAETVVLKVSSADDPAAVREAAALDRGAGEHVVELRDASADDERLVLVLPRLVGDLARVLAERTELEGGEAVTVLAPITATVRRLHAIGVAHGALTPACVQFDADGAPQLTGFGASAVFPPALPEVRLERIPEVAADRAALRDLASGVLGRVGGARKEAAQRLLTQVLAVPDGEVAVRLACGIFEVAAALPVRGADPETTAAAGGRIVPLAAPLPEGVAGGPPRTARWAARLEAWLDGSPAADLRTAALARWRRLPTSRRRLLLGGGAGALALVVAFVAIPTAPAPGATSSTEPGRPSRAAGTADRHHSSAVGAATPAAAPGAGAVRGDDPVAAASALLVARADCRRELSVLCFDFVDQDGSAAAELDRDAVRAAQAGGELAPDPLPRAREAAPALTERLGGSALIGLAGGASLLLVRGDEGWRIRDILTAPAQPSTPPPRG